MHQFLTRIGGLKKAVLVIVLVIALAQVNLHFARLRDTKQAIAEAQTLQGTVWCENNQASQNQNDGSFDTFGGWPCIRLTKISNVKESSATGKSKICAYVTVSQEIGAPGQEVYQDLNPYIQCSVRYKAVSNFSYDLQHKYLLSNYLSELNRIDCIKLKKSLSSDEMVNFCYML